MNTATTRINRLLIPAFIALAGTAALGDVLISNLASNSSSGTVFGTCSTAVFKAAGFTVPAGQDYSLDQVLIEADYDWSGGGETGQYSLWEGAGAPTTRVVTLDPVMRLTGAGVFAFTPASATTLEEGRTYWLYVEPSAPPGGCMLWVAGDADPSGIAINAGYIFNGNPSTFRNKYEVQGTLVTCPCACDFDTSTGQGVCDLIDFTTFAGLFAIGDPCACDLDTSTGMGVCDLIDFTTFAGQFAVGCP